MDFCFCLQITHCEWHCVLTTMDALHLSFFLFQIKKNASFVCFPLIKMPVYLWLLNFASWNFHSSVASPESSHGSDKLNYIFIFAGKKLCWEFIPCLQIGINVSFLCQESNKTNHIHSRLLQKQYLNKSIREKMARRRFFLPSFEIFLNIDIAFFYTQNFTFGFSRK